MNPAQDEVILHVYSYYTCLLMLYMFTHAIHVYSCYTYLLMLYMFTHAIHAYSYYIWDAVSSYCECVVNNLYS